MGKGLRPKLSSGSERCFQGRGAHGDKQIMWQLLSEEVPRDGGDFPEMALLSMALKVCMRFGGIDLIKKKDSYDRTPLLSFF